MIKQPPSTGKKPKLSFKTGSKAKKWVPKTPKKTPKTTFLSGYKSFQKAHSPSPASSVFDTADEEIPLSTAYGGFPAGTPYGGFPPSTAADEVALSTAYEGVYGGEGEGDPFTSPLARSFDALKQSIERHKKLSEDIRRARQEAKERAIQRAQERALKKLRPAPGWKPFGTPTKRRLEDNDW